MPTVSAGRHRRPSEDADSEHGTEVTGVPGRSSEDASSYTSNTEAGEYDPPQGRLNRISRRAFEIYHARGGEHGRDLDDWLRAEEEVDREDR